MKAVVVIEFDLPEDQEQETGWLQNSGLAISYINDPEPKRVFVAIRDVADKIIEHVKDR